jgi:sugar phosphate isomerase/epimerase
MAAAKEIGYESVDLVTDPLDHTDSELDQILRDVADAGLPVAATICMSLGIGDFNPSIQRFHVERAKKHVDFARRAGASNMLIVVGDYLWKKEVIPPERQWDDLVGNMRQIAEHAESLGVEVALELEPYEFSYVNSIGEMVRFLDAVGVDAMRANVDLNHLWMVKEDSSRLSELSGRIAHAHISDCDGVVYRNFPPGEKTAPLQRYLDDLVATGFDGTMAVELEPAPDGRDPIEWMTEGYERTRELLEHSRSRASA